MPNLAILCELRRDSQRRYTLMMPLWIRYYSTHAYWSVTQPFRTAYRYVMRPTDRAAKVIVVHDSKILLVRPNYGHRSWTLPGGKVERNETYEEAARREVREEVGLDVQNLKLIREYVAAHLYHTSQVRAFVTNTAKDYFKVDGIEIAEGAWFPLDALPETLVERSKQSIIKYQSTLSGKPKNQDSSHPTLSRHAPPYS